MNARVIKARAIDGATHSPWITKEVHEASLDAKEIVGRANAQATQLIEDAQRERERLLTQGKTQGYAAGLDQWNDVLVNAWKRRDDFLARNEAELVKLAMAVARKVIGRDVQADPNVVFQIAKEALRSVRGGGRVTIKVNPAEETELRKQAESLKMLGADVGDLVIIGNPSIEHGGCIVESDLGIIDAQIDTQLASIEKALLRRFDDGNR